MRLAIYDRATESLQFFIQNPDAVQVKLLSAAVNQMSDKFLAKSEPDEEIIPEPGSEQFVSTEDVSARIKPALVILKDLMARAEKKRKEEAEFKAAAEALELERQNAVAIDDMSAMLYVSMDGDNIGNQIAQAEMSDDEQKVNAISNQIDTGKSLFENWAKQHNGEVIESGGDEGLVKIPSAGMDRIEEFRTAYKDAVGATVSVGVGSTISQSVKARELAKLRGKNQTVVYDDSTEKELATRTEAKGPETEASKIKESHVLDKSLTKTEFEANQIKEKEYRAWLESKRG